MGEHISEMKTIIEIFRRETTHLRTYNLLSFAIYIYGRELGLCVCVAHKGFVQWDLGGTQRVYTVELA